MFVTNWNSTTKIQKISEITNFFRHYFLSRTEVSYKFLTDYGVQYRIEFVENNNIWEDEKAYEFGILNENKKNSPNDSKVKATIQCIIEEFFLTNPDILLYLM